jgi:hypothetical protein
MGYTVITEKGIVNKDRFYLSKSLVDKFDVHNLWFKITQDEAHSRYRNIELNRSCESAERGDITHIHAYVYLF